MSKLEKEIVIPDIMKKHLDEYVEEYLDSDTDNYVVFNSNAEIKYNGDLKHCCAFVYEQMLEPSTYCIYSTKAYLKMINTINKNDTIHSNL